jgi:hypothetical protein
MQEIAVARGLHLSLKTLGPFYRITCRDGAQAAGTRLAHCTTIVTSLERGIGRCTLRLQQLCMPRSNVAGSCSFPSVHGDFPGWSQINQASTNSVKPCPACKHTCGANARIVAILLQVALKGASWV